MSRWLALPRGRLAALAAGTACSAVVSGQGLPGGAAPTLRGSAGTVAVFASAENPRWSAFRDPGAGLEWTIAGAGLAVDTRDGRHAELGLRASSVTVDSEEASADTALEEVGTVVRRRISFCADGRTLRLRTALRALGDPVALKRVTLLDLRVPGQSFRLMGPGYVSSPVFSERLFAGLEHPSALCRADGESFALAQPAYVTLGPEWREFPAAVFGAASDADLARPGGEGLRSAFLRYLETVRIRPRDLHVHYNDWWTAPVPSSEAFVLGNLAALKQGLFDTTGFFFDSYALDAGWSQPQSLWEMDATHFPQRFAPLRAALEAVGGHVGLWVSPSSLYSFALDNHWLEGAGYEVTPCGPPPGLSACMAKGGRYQAAFKEAVLRYAGEARLAHVKFDGFVPRCDVAAHGHPTGEESCLSLAEGLMDVFDALRAVAPDIALEPTCFGYQPSPWWLMHVPFIIGPFGDDSPYGRCPAPEYVEAMITARDVKNREGRARFLMPSSALQCFDIIAQCPGPFQDLAAMAVGRGRWFISCYINPRYMDTDAWRFFADLMAWARYHRQDLQEPVPIGGDPARREAYGYAFLGQDRHLLCLRNPWIEAATVALPAPPAGPGNLEVRLLYPRRAVLMRLAAEAPAPSLSLGPFETQFIEVVRTALPPSPAVAEVPPEVTWQPGRAPEIESVVFAPEPPAFGPAWTSPDGESDHCTRFVAEGRLSVDGALGSQLCILSEGDPAVARNACRIILDGQDLPVRSSSSEGAFGAAGEGRLEHWAWFMADLPAGEHALRVELSGPALAGPLGVFLRGEVAAPPPLEPFSAGPAFPLCRPERRGWSQVLVPLAPRALDPSRVRSTPRRIERIDGLYLDSLEWTEATVGWGQARRNRSIQEQPMMLGGRIFHRGIGAHAKARIGFAVPAGHRTLAATIGKDQEVSGGSVVFVVEADGREVFRSQVFRNDTPPQDILVPIAGAGQVALVVEDAGDGIGADHADWAEARLLR